MASIPTGNERDDALNKLGLPGQSPVAPDLAEILPQSPSGGMDIKTDGGTVVRATHPGVVGKVVKAEKKFTVEVLAVGSVVNAKTLSSAPLTRYSNLGTVDVLPGQKLQAGTQVGTVSFLRTGGETLLKYQMFKNAIASAASEVLPQSEAGLALIKAANPGGQSVDPEAISREPPPEGKLNDPLVPPREDKYDLGNVSASADRYPYTSRPQVKFAEQNNQVFTHDFLVYINGVDVTKYVVDSVSVALVDKDGWNEAHLKLNNATDNFLITMTNLGVGDDVTAKFRNTDIPGEDKYSERAKREIIEYKNDPERNPFIDITTMEMIEAGASQGIPGTSGNFLGGGTNRDIGVSSSTSLGGDGSPEESPETQKIDRRWQLGFMSTVFHKNDPIRIFRKNPLREADEWMPAFTGYLETVGYDTKYKTGLSLITLKCYDIRALISKMRVQTTSVLTITNPRAVFRGRSGKSDSLFSDLLEPTVVGSPLAGKRFEDVMEFLITGAASADPDLSKRFGKSNFQRGVGDFMLGDKISYVPGEYRSGKSPDPLEHWHALCLFGMDGKTVLRVSGTGDKAKTEKKSLTNTGKELSAEFNRRWLTEAEARHIGSQTTHDGPWSPHKQFVHFLLPAEGTGAKNLLDFDAFNANSNQLDFRSRLDIMQDFANRIDYQFWVTPIGDIVVEFPMYDFFPKDFQEYKNVFKVDKHLVSDNIQDEAGDIITAIIAHGSISPLRDINLPPEQFQPKAVVVSPLMMMRYGVIEHELTLPFIATSDALARLAQIEFQKKLSEANKMDMDFDYRPFITPNRPIENVERKRLGLSSAVRNDVSIFKAGRTAVTLRYIRRQIFRQDGKAAYTFISGGESMPITYRDIYEPGTIASIGKNITGGSGGDISVAVHNMAGSEDFSAIAKKAGADDLASTARAATAKAKAAAEAGAGSVAAGGGSSVGGTTITSTSQPILEKINAVASPPHSPKPSDEQRARFAALAQQTSSWNPAFRDQESGRMGLFGLLPEVRKETGVDDSTDEDVQIKGADKYFRGLVQKYKGDLDKVVEEFVLGAKAIKNVNLVKEFKKGFGAANKALGETFEELSQPVVEGFKKLFPGDKEPKDTPPNASSDEAKLVVDELEKEAPVPSGQGFKTSTGVIVYDNRDEIAQATKKLSETSKQAATAETAETAAAATAAAAAAATAAATAATAAAEIPAWLQQQLAKNGGA